MYRLESLRHAGLAFQHLDHMQAEAAVHQTRQHAHLDAVPIAQTRLHQRGKRGAIARFHGVHVFPDTNAHGRGEDPQPLYSVSFDARELWGESAEANQRVHIDLWESYLEPGE